MNTSIESVSPADRQPKTKGGYLFLPTRLSRGAFLKWLRRIHAWFGLWLAALGLLFGTSGLLLNHRDIMKIPAAKMEQKELQLTLPEPKPANAKAMAAWLGQTLDMNTENARIKQDKAKPVVWNNVKLEQPPLWQINVRNPKRTLQAEYWLGNDFVNIKLGEANFFALLTNLHRGSGMGVNWILFSDTLAIGLILLSLTGVLLWSGLHGRRLAAAGLGFGSLSLIGILAWQAIGG
ncbi:MAG: PepSY-associated TM helix domain-containing protein [Methylococcaceae bacterium]|jgi:hypothetical protein